MTATTDLEPEDDFKGLKIAQKVMRSMRAAARDEINKLRPAPRVAVVKSIDADTKSCMVVYPGETDLVRVPYNNIAPNEINQIVRIEGTSGDRYITAIIGTSKTDANVIAVDEKATSAVDTASGAVTTANNASTKADAVSTAVTSGAVGQPKPANADSSAYASTKALYDLAAQTQADVVQIRQSDNAVGGGALQKTLMFPNGPINTTDLSADPSQYVYNGQLALAGGLNDGFYQAKINYQYTSDTQAINGSLGDNANVDQTSFLVLRASVDYTSGVAVRIGGNGVQIGTIAGYGTATNFFTSVSSLGRTMTSSDNVELRASGNIFVVLINGNAVLSYNGVLGNVGGSYRNSFVIKQKASGAFGIVFYSFNFRTIGIYDFGGTGASATTRKGIRYSRPSTQLVTVNVANGSFGPLPSGFFAVTDFNQSFNALDVSLGKAKATVAAWYRFAANFTVQMSTTEVTTTVPAYWCLYVNDVLVTGPIPVGSTVDRELFVDDVVQVGYANVMPQVEMFGTSDGRYGATKNTAITRIGGGPGANFQILIDNPAA